MKHFLQVLLCFFPMFVFSQNEFLAQNYFDRGEFDKAILIYEDLVKASPGNPDYFKKELFCYQQLKQFEKAQNVINAKLDRTKQPYLFVELGYNYQLQKKQDKADKNYEIAIDKIVENANNVFMVATTFEQKSLIVQAIKAYETGNKINPEFKFDYQIALLQGQLGNLELMTDKLLDYSFLNPMNMPLVQNQLVRFMAEDSQKVFTDYLRKSLLLRTQKTQDIFWNQFMSWFFVQQKEYGKAFVQEKAIYKRNPDSLGSIIALAKLTIDEKQSQTATEILHFILQNTQDIDLKIQAEYELISMQVDVALPNDYETVSKNLEQLLATYGQGEKTFRIQILKAHFEGFSLDKFEQAKGILSHLMELPLNAYQMAETKIELADLLLRNQKFNQAILYYAQVQDDLPNDEQAHEASLKMAQASYFNQDFDWAQKQFSVLKSSTSQLIANDAMQAFLLISDNAAEDSTHVALKKFAKADFLAFQNRTSEALTAFKEILQQHKGQSIEDETLFKLGKLYEKQNDFNNALTYYQEIIDKHSEEIYIDEALFFSAEIYRKYLANPEKAKKLYEEIIFKHQDSIYFVEAQSNYRKLRGDTNL